MPSSPYLLSLVTAMLTLPTQTYLNLPYLEACQYQIMKRSAMPLKSVETQFAVDSTGFRTTKFGEYCHIKYNSNKRHKFLKAHLLIGTKTNIVASAQITDENGADSLKFIPLTITYQNGFSLNEVSADKTYSERANLDAIAEHGGVAYVPFKINASQHGHLGKVWNKMFYYFQMCRDEFIEHHHKKSNIEMTNMAIKSKFGDRLKNKNIVSQTNELLCKLMAYNITVLISAIYELNIEPKLIS